MTLVSALVLSGPPGVGKTTVGWRVFDRCTDLGQDPAFVDLDLMGAAWPAPEDDPHQARLKATNLAAVWSNYRAAGSRRLIIAGVVEDQGERKLLEVATGGAVVICRLEAPDDELAQRILGRGRESGADVAKLAARAAELSAQLAAHDVSDYPVGTAGRTIDEVADEVLARWDMPS
ncbi:AAA family ATPase [Kribbella sp. NBC_00889]|uniref:AAA family ATPase n=1 Tax=Kribbella sp. NBC_00889 TaxID=2975974 RepID=UPI003868719E|nr:AAA family ATPase [Kribbella sp. NBC_00889]